MKINPFILYTRIQIIALDTIIIVINDNSMPANMVIQVLTRPILTVFIESVSTDKINNVNTDIEAIKAQLRKARNIPVIIFN